MLFASGKDRAVAGAPLHTNFKLAKDGEYLALVADDGETIVSSFGDQYPPQTDDISFGMAQPVTDVSLHALGDPARYLVPGSDTLGQSWTEVDFDDTSWTVGATGLGYSFRTEYDSVIAPCAHLVRWTSMSVQMRFETKPGAVLQLDFWVGCYWVRRCLQNNTRTRPALAEPVAP